MEHNAIRPFELFWDANRANEHKQSRALGLFEKRLTEAPNDVLAQVCKACLMIQMSHEWDAAENQTRAISVALDIIQESRPATPDTTRCKIEFAVGVSLAQLPYDAAFAASSASILQHLIDTGGVQTHFTPEQQQETYIALSAVYQATDDANQARRAYLLGKALGESQAADIFADYQQLMSSAYSS